MANGAFDSSFTALLGRSQPNGAFAVAEGGPSRPDATAWAAMALFAAGRAPDVAAAARKALAQAQTADGRVPVLPERPEAAWPTALAIGAWLPDVAYAENVRAAAAWLLAHPGANWVKKDDTIFGHDTSLKGWNWIEGTHSWVEPTAQAMLVLTAVTPPPRAALDEAVRLLGDRQLPDGGWNYGNTRVFRNILLPIPECTGHALAALAGRVPRETVAKSLAYLAGPDCAAATPLTAAWRTFGLGAWGEAGPDAEKALLETLARQDRYGPYDTPLLAQVLAAAATGGRFAALLREDAHVPA